MTPQSKYHNRKTEYAGFLFDSQAEARRYQELLLLEKAGEVFNIERQHVVPLVVNRVKVGVWKADFRYVVVSTGILVYEDVKSPATQKNPVYRLKKRLVKAIHGIDISEVMA